MSRPKSLPKTGTTALAGWFGSNRMMANHVGEALEGCNHVVVGFAGGMSEVLHIAARTILVNDKHSLVMNLARVVADDKLRPELVRRLRRKAFHPEELSQAQQVCITLGDDAQFPSLVLAVNYFVCCWMGRASKAGIDDEFNGRPAIRWNANGGDSAVRYFSAVRMLVPFSQSLRRCTFETMDIFDLLARCEDNPENAIYLDPPFFVAGRRYRFNAGQTEAEEVEWHTQLRDYCERFQNTRVVVRFYDHPHVRRLYDAKKWEYHSFVGRTQANGEAPELLLVLNGPKRNDSLFGELLP